MPLHLLQASGEYVQLDAKFDTGFNGDLGLPSDVLNGLASEPEDDCETRFANGTRQVIKTYRVVAKISDEERELIALDLDQGGPLLGMGSLPNWVSTIELKVNGEVRIEPIEQKRGG